MARGISIIMRGMLTMAGIAAAMTALFTHPQQAIAAEYAWQPTQIHSGMTSGGYLGQFMRLEKHGNTTYAVMYESMYRGLILFTSTNDGKTWSAPMKLDLRSGAGLSVATDIDSQGRLHAVYTRDGDNTSYVLEHGYLDNGKWITETLTADEEYAVFAWRQSLFIDSNDTLHVTYQDQTYTHNHMRKAAGSSEWVTQPIDGTCQNVSAFQGIRAEYSAVRDTGYVGLKCSGGGNEGLNIFKYDVASDTWEHIDLTDTHYNREGATLSMATDDKGYVHIIHGTDTNAVRYALYTRETASGFETTELMEGDATLMGYSDLTMHNGKPVGTFTFSNGFYVLTFNGSTPILEEVEYTDRFNPDVGEMGIQMRNDGTPGIAFLERATRTPYYINTVEIVEEEPAPDTTQPEEDQNTGSDTSTDDTIDEGTTVVAAITESRVKKVRRKKKKLRWKHLDDAVQYKVVVYRKSSGKYKKKAVGYTANNSIKLPKKYRKRSKKRKFFARVKAVDAYGNQSKWSKRVRINKKKK